MAAKSEQKDDRMLQLVRGVQYSHELLAKIESIKTYTKQMKNVGELTPDEYTVLARQTATMEQVARNIIRDRERRFERAGGVFNRPTPPEFHTRK